MGNDLNFGDVIAGLKQGKRYARRGWHGMSMFVFYVPSDVPSSNAPHGKVLGDDQVISKRRDFLMMRTSDGDIVPWVASQSDILECDWEEVVMPFDEGVHR